MKKYYAWFIYNNEEYVIRFRIKGSLQWDEKERCFMDKDWYVRTIKDLVSLAGFDTSYPNNKHLRLALKITHNYFRELRAKGVKRWTPKRETIICD
jgi:hypothetical protein